jgi:hypothetical protein
MAETLTIPFAILLAKHTAKSLDGQVVWRFDFAQREGLGMDDWAESKSYSVVRPKSD